MVVIGLGQAGAEICSKIGHIRTIVVDGGKNLPKCSTHEEYEASVPKMANKLKLGKEQDIWLIVAGAGNVSGVVLALLEQLKNRTVNVVHITSDPILLTKTKKKQEKVVYNVLQEYARSGMIDGLWLISNQQIQSWVGEDSIGSYYDKINDAIANFISNVAWFENNPPFMGSLFEAKEISRIKTVSLGDPNKNEENLYFLLDNITETCYYYSISEEDQENKPELLKSIRAKISNDVSNNIESSFGIWKNTSGLSYFYSIKYTHYIQGGKNE